MGLVARGRDALSGPAGRDDGQGRDALRDAERFPQPFDNIISHPDANDLIPEDVASEVIKLAAQQSAALSLFRRVQLSAKVARLPVLSALPVAYFVNGDTGLKQTTDMAWQGVALEAEEIAAIVPVPEAVVDDADFDLWGEVQEALGEAVGLALDAAVFAGTTKLQDHPESAAPINAAFTVNAGYFDGLTMPPFPLTQTEPNTFVWRRVRIAWRAAPAARHRAGREAGVAGPLSRRDTKRRRGTSRSPTPRRRRSPCDRTSPDYPLERAGRRPDDRAVGDEPRRGGSPSRTGTGTPRCSPSVSPPGKAGGAKRQRKRPAR